MDRTNKTYPGTRIRTVRVDDELWAAAHETAIQRGEYISDILREALRAYVGTSA